VKKLYSIFLALLLFLISCGSGNKNEPVVVPTSITLDKTNVVLAVKQTTQISATVLPYNAATWTSSNPSVATVSTSGLVTAMSGGEADIVVTAREATATCKVIVATGSVDYSWLVVGEDQGRAMVWTDRGNYDLGIGVARHVEKSNDGILFIAGESEGRPTLWIGNEFEKHILSETKGKGNFVYLKDDDVYVAGQVSEQATYWKNEAWVVLPSPSSAHTTLNSEAKSMIINTNGVYIVGSGEFSRIYNLVPQTGRIRSALDWKPWITYPFVISGDLMNTLTIDALKIANDGSIIYVETIDYKGTVFGRLYVTWDNAGTSGSQSLTYNNENVYAYDLIPHGPFKTEPSKDNAALVATNVGVYRVTGIPNKAYGPAGLTNMPCTLLPGYGYSKSVKLLGDDIYSAGRNIIYKNGSIFKELPPTAEIYCLLVQ